MDSMDAYSNDYEEVLRKALERIKQLKEENQALSAELTTVTGQLGSGQSYQGKIEELERENQQLTAELHTTRKKLQALKDVVTKSFADLKQEAQHLNKKLDAAYTVLDLYELLYEASPSETRTERGGGQTLSGDNREDQVIVSLGKRLKAVPGDRHQERARPSSDLEEPLGIIERPDQQEAFPETHDIHPDPELEAIDQQLLGHRAERSDTTNAYHETVIPFESRHPQTPPVVDPLAGTDLDNQPDADTEHMGATNEIDLIASPFTRFDTINRFTASVRSLPGVTEAKVRHFQKGTLRMLVEYENVVPFVSRLRELTQFKLRIDSSSDRRVAVTLETLETGPLSASSAR